MRIIFKSIVTLSLFIAGMSLKDTPVEARGGRGNHGAFGRHGGFGRGHGQFGRHGAVGSRHYGAVGRRGAYYGGYSPSYGGGTVVGVGAPLYPYYSPYSPYSPYPSYYSRP